MRAEAYYFVADLFLKSLDNRNGENHKCDPESHAGYGNSDDWSGKFIPTCSSRNPFRYQLAQIHIETKVIECLEVVEQPSELKSISFVREIWRGVGKKTKGVEPWNL